MFYYLNSFCDTYSLTFSLCCHTFYYRLSFLSHILLPSLSPATYSINLYFSFSKCEREREGACFESSGFALKVRDRCPHALSSWRSRRTFRLNERDAYGATFLMRRIVLPAKCRSRCCFPVMKSGWEDRDTALAATAAAAAAMCVALVREPTPALLSFAYVPRLTYN